MSALKGRGPLGDLMVVPASTSSAFSNILSMLLETLPSGLRPTEPLCLGYQARTGNDSVRTDNDKVSDSLDGQLRDIDSVDKADYFEL